MAYETWGELDRNGTNAVLVLHALTGDSHAAGPAAPGHTEVGWWDGMIGPGAPIDTDRFFVVCPNVLGGCQGSTGPASSAPNGTPYGSRFPMLTVRDQVAAEVALADRLGIGTWRRQWWGDRWGACGSSSGVSVTPTGSTGPSSWPWGRRRRPSRSDCARCRSGPSSRIRPFPAGDYYLTGARPDEGLALARGIGQVSYRTDLEFEGRFGRKAQAEEDPRKGGRFAVESYLQHHGDKLARRFDANSYIVLSEAMNQHDVGRDRGGVELALARVRADVTVAGI